MRLLEGERENVDKFVGLVRSGVGLGVGGDWNKQRVGELSSVR